MAGTFTAPTEEDIRHLASQWLSVSRVSEEEFGSPLTQSLDDLELIQRLLNEDIVDRRTYALQCLGIALGRVMATNIEGLDWWIVEDEFGRDPCLRYKHTTLQINPLTMISKRVERGDEVDVRWLYEKTVEAVSERRSEVS